MKAFILSALAVVSLTLAVAAPAFAQLVADPNDRLYTDLEMWLDRGMMDQLPPLRPYPVQLVLKALNQVAARGDESDRNLANWYLSKIQGGSNFHGVASSTSRTNLAGGYEEGALEATMQGSVYPWITYSARIGALAFSGPISSLLPEYQRSLSDFVSDAAVRAVGSLTPQMTMIGSGSIGNDGIYVQAGAIRGSYGPFWGDNAVLSPTSPQSGQFSFVFHNNAMTGTMLLMDMSATNPSGGQLSADKFLSLGGLEFYPLDWLTIGVFDTMVWGQRFEPLYLLPVVSFYTEGMAGYPDNAFIGVSTGVKFPGAWKANFLLYVDDAGFNDLIRLNFNTMLLFALQAGVSWTPNLPFLARIRVTNILITPYTYSHESYGGTAPVNYLNYTNNGQNIGPSINPNSDRLEVEALIRPANWVDVNLFGRFIIHGNATTGANLDGSPNDGSVWDDGIDATGDTFAPSPSRPGWTYTRFLTQSVLEKVLQAGFDTRAYLETGIGEVQVSLSYTFEYMLDGTVAGQGPVSGNDAITHYISLGVAFTY